MADDVNSMQGSLGLDMGPPTPSATPTPPIYIPQTKHPGEMSAELSEKTQAQAMQTRAAVMSFTAPTMPVFNPATGNMMPMGASAGFGQQYAANMAAIAGGHMSPYSASMFGSMPINGLNAAMMPAAGGLTDPALGVYRTRMAMGMGMGMGAYPYVPREPLIRGPFDPGLPGQMYTSPMETAENLGMMRSAQYHGAALAAVGMGGRMAVGAGGSALGNMLGAAAGAAIGGPVGARIGGVIGSIGGGLIADSTLGQGLTRLMEENPLTNIAQRAAQVQGISAGFVTGGTGVGPSGRGLDASGSVDVARALQRAGYAEAAGFNAADYTKILDQGSKAGLFDASQSVSDIKSRVTQVAGTLKQFMSITNDPDITNAIKELGGMRNMGLSLNEAVVATQNAKMYARSAGTSLEALKQYSQAGAFTFQAQGLTGGLGSQIGASSYASARNAVASGAMSESQLAELGGVSGLAQRQMENVAATLKIPMLTRAVTRMQDNGAFGLDPDLVKQLAGGQLDVHDMTRLAGQNMLEAIGKQGPAAIGMFQAQETDLQDRLGRALGPTTLQMMPFIQTNLLRQRMNLPQTPSGFASAAAELYPNDPDQVKALMYMASSPDYFRKQQQAIEAEQQSRAMKESQEFTGQVAAARTKGGVYGRTIGRMSDAIAGMFEPASDAFSKLSLGISQYAQDTAIYDQGGTPFRRGSAATPANEAERAAVARLAPSAFMKEASPEVLRAMNAPDGYTGLSPEGIVPYLDDKMGAKQYTLMPGVRNWMRQAGRVADGTRVADLVPQAVDFAVGERAVAQLMDATPEQRQAARAQLETQYGAAGLRERLTAYGQALTETANAAGPSPAFQFTGGWFGDAPKAARGSDFRALNAKLKLSEEEGALMRMAGGEALISGVTNPMFLDRAPIEGALTSSRIQAVRQATDSATMQMASGMFGTDPSARHIDAMRQIFTASPDGQTATLAGLMGAQLSKNPEQAQGARAALGEYVAQLGIMPSQADPTYNAALELQKAIRRAPDGERTLSELGARAMAVGPEAMASSIQQNATRFQANQQVQDNILMGMALQQQTAPAYRDAVGSAFQSGGVNAALQAAYERGGAGAFVEGSTAQRAMETFLQKATNTNDASAASQFQRSVLDSMQLGASGSISSRRDPALEQASNTIGITGEDMAATFPAAVATFSTASKDFGEAVNLWTRGMRRQNSATTGLTMPYGDWPGDPK